MISDDTINKYLRDILAIIIDDEDYLIVKADQNAPRPKVPYCTVKIMASRVASLEEFSEEDEGEDSGKLTTRALRNIRVSFNFFRREAEENDPFYIASLCRQALNRISITELLTEKGLGLADRSQVKNMTFELDSGFEERASFIATFNFVDTDTEIVTTIDELDINGEYQYNDRVTGINIKVENDN